MAQFTEEQKQYINKNWSKTSIHKMAKHLGCSFSKLRVFMVDNNIPTGTFRKNKNEFNGETKVNPYRIF